MTKRSTLILCAILSAALVPAFAQSAPDHKDQPWFDSSQTLDKRVDALVHAMTLEEKAGQMVEPRRRHPPPRRSRVRLLERRSARHRAFRLCHALSAGHWPRRYMGRPPSAPGRRRHLHRSARQIRAGDARQPAQHLFRPHHLVAEHQYLSRSALGPRPGNLRRRPLPHQPHGRRLCRRPAGRRPEILPHHRHAQALRRTQRARADPPRIQCRSFTARPRGHLSSRLPRHHQWRRTPTPSCAAYNAVDSVPACANTKLLQHYLYQDWGFHGFVTSDCGAISDFYSATGHHYSPDMPRTPAPPP